MMSDKPRVKKKQIKQLITELLQSEPDRMETVGLFMDEGTTRAALLVEALYSKAKQGDVKAFETIMKYAGEDPDQKRKDAELKLKRELLQLRKHQFDIDNEIEPDVREAAINARLEVMNQILEEIKKVPTEENITNTGDM